MFIINKKRKPGYNYNRIGKIHYRPIQLGIRFYFGVGREVLQVVGEKTKGELNKHAAVDEFCNFFLGGFIGLWRGPLLPLYLVCPVGRTNPASAQKSGPDFHPFGNLFPPRQDFGQI